jgi:hypothetical protein
VRMNSNHFKAIIYPVIFFLSGGLVLTSFDFFTFDHSRMGEPAIYYHKIEITDEAGEPLTGATFSWSNSMSLVMKSRAPYVIDEIVDGVYVIAIAGRYQISSVDVWISKEGFADQTIRMDAFAHKGAEFGEDNCKIGNQKVVMRKE